MSGDRPPGRTIDGDNHVLLLRDAFESGKLCNVHSAGGKVIGAVTISGYDLSYIRLSSESGNTFLIDRHQCSLIEILGENAPVAVVEITPTQLRDVAQAFDESLGTWKNGGVLPYQDIFADSANTIRVRFQLPLEEIKRKVNAGDLPHLKLTDEQEDTHEPGRES